MCSRLFLLVTKENNEENHNDNGLYLLCTKLISVTVLNYMCSLKPVYFQDIIVSHIILVTVTVHYLCSRLADHCNVAHLDAVNVCVQNLYLYFLPGVRSKGPQYPLPCEDRLC